MASDLDITFRQAVLAARRAEIDTEGWALQKGSKLNGISYELVTPQRRIKLGKTGTDATRTLDGMTQAFWLAKP